MDASALYQSKLTTPEQAVEAIPSGTRLSMGMFAAQPPALLKALADRAATGAVDDLRVYYFEAARIAGDTILRHELNDRIHPYCMFITAVERTLIKRGMDDGGRKLVNYVPSNFHQAVRLLTEEIGIDTFVCTVSPMDRHGYMSFGTGNDYSTKVRGPARRAGDDAAHRHALRRDRVRCVNLKGLSSTERAKALIGLAHPEFRDELTEAAKELHLI